MRYSRVFLESMGYEIPPVVITSEELEERLWPVYQKLMIPAGQLEAITGIYERRWWEPDFPLSQGAIAASRKALQASPVKPEEIDILIYGAVCREDIEPATACRVAAALGISSEATIYDLSNACLGQLNGIVNVANHIELGQCRAGLVVCCESAREIVEIAIADMFEQRTLASFANALPVLTGGSGAVAMLLTDGSFSHPPPRRLLGGVTCADPQFHRLCRWGMEISMRGDPVEIMRTDAASVLKYGVELGRRTWNRFLTFMDWSESDVDKTICHQVAESNRNAILNAFGVDPSKDFITYPYLGNTGSVALPITAAIATEREFLKPGDQVGFLGIGSGLNCMMLGWRW